MESVYFGREILLKQLSSNVAFPKNIDDLIPTTVYSRIDAIQPNSNSTNHFPFLFYQLFIHQFCFKSSSQTNKNDFLDIITNYYSSNGHELKEIHQKNTFSWFKRDCFISRLLTKSLLALDIEILFSVRFFIKDMQKIWHNSALRDFLNSLSRCLVFYLRSNVIVNRYVLLLH
jgi:hypothetical protein